MENQQAKPPKKDRFVLVISDCHLSAGRFFEGRMNPHEDFKFDDEMCDLFQYFSRGKYGSWSDGSPVELELVIAGDYFDYLNVPVKGEFEDGVTEEIAVYKTKAIIEAHPKVMHALRQFASLPGKTITYLIGNHDADLLFANVREMIVRTWDPNAAFPSEKVKIVHDKDRLTYADAGFEIRHGNQFEAGNELDFNQPFVVTDTGSRLLNLPWGSVYVLKIVNQMKWEREYLDKIRPIKVFVLLGLIMDPFFTMRFVFLSSFYFIKTRIFSDQKGWLAGFKKAAKIIKNQSSVFFQDLETEARQLLDESKEIKTVIFGHTHRPMNKVYPDGKQYINTGTWTKMIDLDWRGIGQQYRRTFAFVHIKDGQAQCELKQWVGESGPHQTFGG